MALADDSSPVFTAGAMDAGGVRCSRASEEIAAALRGGGGRAWGDHHPCLFKGTEWPDFRIPGADAAV